MKTLIISDTHFTKKFEENRFNFIKGLIQKADYVIINGDLWEGYIISFDDFVNSEWKRLFPLFKEKHATYIYGNHDPKRWNDNRKYLFSDEQSTEKHMNINGIELFITHGHLLSGHPGKISFIKYLRKRWKFSVAFMLFVYNTYRKILCKIFGFNAKRIGILTKKYDILFKKIAKANYLDNKYYLLGHSHVARAMEDIHYYNSGFINFGLATYLIVSDDPFKIELIEERY